MAYVISDECTMCGCCKDSCPVEAIAEGDPKYVIDADACTDCGTCEGECPVSAISAVSTSRTCRTTGRDRGRWSTRTSRRYWT